MLRQGSQVVAAPATHPGPPHPSAILSSAAAAELIRFWWPGLVYANAVNKLDFFAQNGPDAAFSMSLT